MVINTHQTCPVWLWMFQMPLNNEGQQVIQGLSWDTAWHNRSKTSQSITLHRKQEYKLIKELKDQKVAMETKTKTEQSNWAILRATSTQMRVSSTTRAVATIKVTMQKNKELKRRKWAKISWNLEELQVAPRKTSSSNTCKSSSNCWLKRTTVLHCFKTNR